jgi:hypothetical protein
VSAVKKELGNSLAGGDFFNSACTKDFVFCIEFSRIILQNLFNVSDSYFIEIIEDSYDDSADVVFDLIDKAR